MPKVYSGAFSSCAASLLRGRCLALRVMVNGGRGAEDDTEDDCDCDDDTTADAVLDLVLLEVASRGAAGLPDAAKEKVKEKVVGKNRVGVRFVIWGPGGRAGSGARACVWGEVNKRLYTPNAP